MSDQFGDYYSRLGPPRPLSDAEHRIVEKLVRSTASPNKLLDQLRNAQVRNMPDGGMGSLYFCSDALEWQARMSGEQIAEGAFMDADGIPVSVTLDLDNRGDLYELDVFKTDGSPLLRYPDVTDIEIIERHGQLGFPPVKS